MRFFSLHSCDQHIYFIIILVTNLTLGLYCESNFKYHAHQIFQSLPAGSALHVQQQQENRSLKLGYYLTLLCPIPDNPMSFGARFNHVACVMSKSEVIQVCFIMPPVISMRYGGWDNVLCCHRLFFTFRGCSGHVWQYHLFNTPLQHHKRIPVSLLSSFISWTHTCPIPCSFVCLFVSGSCFVENLLPHLIRLCPVLCNHPNLFNILKSY